MKKISINNLISLNFFLANREKVTSLNAGAKKHGGATKTKAGIYSNYEGENFININEEKNTLSLLIPSTINVDEKIDNAEYVEYYFKLVASLYDINNLIVYNTNGSWYSDDLKKVVIEDITIIELNIEKVTENDINTFLMLASEVKENMNQEGVSVLVNDALCIV